MNSNGHCPLYTSFSKIGNYYFVNENRIEAGRALQSIIYKLFLMVLGLSMQALKTSEMDRFISKKRKSVTSMISTGVGRLSIQISKC